MDARTLRDARGVRERQQSTELQMVIVGKVMSCRYTAQRYLSVLSTTPCSTAPHAAYITPHVHTMAGIGCLFLCHLNHERSPRGGA